jgi:Fe/S biogenesis protein NfuA
MKSNSEVHMITITETAKKQLIEALASDGKSIPALRITARGGGMIKPTYDMQVADASKRGLTDTVVDLGEFTVLVDEPSKVLVDGAVIDFLETASGSGFHISNPNLPPPPEPNLDSPEAKTIQKLLDEQINPGVSSHGGHVSLVDVRDDNVYVRLSGGCQGCGMADVTLKQGIETAIKEAVPTIKAVLDTTDHAGGSNPYYQPSK